MYAVAILAATFAALLGAVHPVASFKADRFAFAHGRSAPNRLIIRPDVTRTTTTEVHGAAGKDGGDVERTEDGDFVAGNDEYEGSVDWDAEWKKVVDEKDQPAKRPGSYKSQAEVAAIKATNKVAKNVYDASREMKSNMPQAPSLPSFGSLSGDWRFWIGIIAVVSFGLALISASGQTTLNDSIYI